MRIMVLTILYYGAALYGLRYPVFGLMFFIHIVIFRPESLVWGSYAFGRLHLITALIVVAGYLLQRRSLVVAGEGLHQKKNLFNFALFLVWLAIVSFLAEASPPDSFAKALELLKIFVICAVFAKIVNTKIQMEYYVRVVVISFGLLALWGFQQSLLGNERLDTLWPGGSNYIASQMALIAPLAMAKASDRNMPLMYRLVFIACASFMILCSFATQSRGAFLGLALGMFIFLFFVRYRVRAFAALLLITVLIYPWVGATYVDRIGSAFAPAEERDASAESRFALWQVALRIWQDYPIAGVGLDNFTLMRKAYAGKVSDIITREDIYNLIFDEERYQERHPHSVYTGMMAETGLIGVGLFVVLLLRNIFVRLPKKFLDWSSSQSLYLQAKGSQAGIVGFAFAALFYDLQYIEMLYLQIFFIGAIKTYADSMQNSEVAMAPR